MKKSLLALAVLGAFAGAASAQSSVTLYGRVDLSVAKNLGSADKVMQNGSGSRLGLRGVEDLGGGTSAFFNIEHRFDADTGVQQGQVTTAQNCVSNTTGAVVATRTVGQGASFEACPPGSRAVASATVNRFWSARSLVGLQGGFGKISLGREYTTAFLGSQLANDPWGWDTVVAANTAAITGLSIASVRNDSSVTYNFAASGFAFGAQIAEASDSIVKYEKKPVNFSLGYGAGPLAVNFGYERTGAEGKAAAKVMTLGGSYDLGAVKLGASYAKGTTVTNVDRKSYMFTAVAPMGQGELRAALGQRKSGGVKDIGMLAVGYHYALSKRTTVYADFVRNSELAAEKTAYDFGIKHNF